jgi:hypothetical protein
MQMMPRSPEFQKKALEAFLNSPEGKAFKPIFEDKEAEKKADTFKGPQGFGSVIGVGANPVMEAMTRQTEVLEEIKAVLEEQNLMRKGGTVPAPFTETVPLPVQKAGSF